MKVFKYLFLLFNLVIGTAYAVTFHQYNEPSKLWTGEVYSSSAQPEQLTKVPYLGSFDDKASAIYTYQPPPYPYESSCVFIFSDTNFRGDWELIDHGNVEDLADWSDWNFMAHNMTGEPTIGFDNKMSSFIVFSKLTLNNTGRGCIFAVAYRYRDFNPEGGQTYPIPLGMIVTDLGSFNNRASSVKVPAGTCLKVWKKTPSNYPNYATFYNNPDAFFYPGAYNFPDDLHNEASSLELVVQTRPQVVGPSPSPQLPCYN